MAGILVVEDEVVVAMDIQASLARLGYEVVGTAASADEALAHATKRAPDLALVDIHIKGDLDGIETAQLLKTRFDTPIVYLTAFADDETVARAKTTQPYGYVVKPFSPKELKSAVEIALYKHALEAQLRERERWFSTTLRSIGDGVIAVDPHGKVSFMNVVAEDLTGAREAQAKGRALSDVFRIVDEDTRADVADPVARAIAEGRVVDLPPNSLLVPRAGDARPIEDSAAPIVDAGGTLLGAVIVFRDVSDRRRLQQQIVMSDRLASLGTLAAGVGHEINNPLAVIIANLSFLDQEVQDLEREPPPAGKVEEIKRIVAELREEADRIRRIVGDLKVFARPPDERRLPIDPLECLEWALRVTANQTQHKAKLVRAIAKMPMVEASASQLGQVFVNLLVNAAHAIPDRAADKNEIRVSAGTDTHGRAVVSINDSGPGLPPDKLRRIFDPFTSSRITGAGLGLAICHGLVRALGGEIEVASQPGEGTTFTVTLPQARAEKKHTPTPPPPSAVQRVRGRVLVIDDEPLLVNAVRRTLAADHEVTVVTDPAQALEQLEGGARFDLVLCDLMMPGISGMDVYERVHELLPEMARRFCFITGGAFTLRAAEFLASVENPMIEKPFSPETLRAFVQAFLRKAGTVS